MENQTDIFEQNHQKDVIFIEEDRGKKFIDNFTFTSNKCPQVLPKENKLNQHYARLNPQTIYRMQDVLTPEEFQGFCRGNILKYTERMRHKDKPLNEALKIQDYARWLVQSLKGEKISL